MPPDISNLPTEEALDLIGQYIDHAASLKSAEMAKQSLQLCYDLGSRVSGDLEVEICYFRANAWSVIRQAKHKDKNLIWHWDQEEILHEVYWLRYAIQHSNFGKINKLRQSQILVNTANILNHIGRPIEAIEYWKRALSVTPRFAMALGNLGLGYEDYAKQLYGLDDGYAFIILKVAHDFLSNIDKDVVWDNPGFENIQQQMLIRASLIAKHVDLNYVASMSLDNFSLGSSKREREYRHWALNNHLFINPLNDIGTYAIAAQDILHLPAITVALGAPPYLLGFYNQIKQEFITARYIFWEGSLSAGNYRKEFPDKDVLLVNTLDYSIYGISVEKIKLAFRSAYSIFDKIAFFINDYWELDIPHDKVSFHSVWLEPKGKGKGKKELRQAFYQHPNLSLRGLYWLSKEFSDKEKTEEIVLGCVMEPDAGQLRTIRNELEHKYLKVHDDIWAYGKEHESSLFSDSLAHHLTLTELTEKTLRLLKRSREALIYLSLAVHQEERVKNETRTGRAMSMTLPYLE